ncbi:MAG: hypothetical protein ACRC20_06160 [Segniliparus sp.]|uniref:hypothetical protein n=1 Tax=Segniliparus sp. TaxID=2804064 RepID=UPI003F2DC41B
MRIFWTVAAWTVAALALALCPAAQADRLFGQLVLRCEVWGDGGPDGVHLRGYAQGLGGSREEAQADAERDMRSAYGFGPRLGHCAVAFG